MSPRASRWCPLLLLAIALPLGSCSEEPAVGPPEIVYGVSACEICRMIISDERYAAGIAAHDEHGDLLHLAFDDVGCMLRYEAEHPQAAIVGRYVKDRNTRAWIDADLASFVHCRTLQTPMASGVAAFAGPDQADAFLAEQSGERLDLEGLRDRYRTGNLTAGPS